MGKKSIIEFLLKWIEDETFRQRILHREVSEMRTFGLDGEQIKRLTRLKPGPIGRQIALELGVDLEEVRNAIFPQPDPELSNTGGFSTMVSVAAAGYDEGQTHIRRVRPGIVPVSTATKVVLWGQGFRWEPARITVEFSQKGAATVTGTVTKVDCGVDVWQRVHVDVAAPGLTAGGWEILAHNDDDWRDPMDHSLGYLWSSPPGSVHAR
jgi:hypothetical protein